jgi:polyisoprenoid-binding protein YceI
LVTRASQGIRTLRPISNSGIVKGPQMSTAVLIPASVTASGRHVTGRWVIAPQQTSVTTRVRALGIPVRGRFGHATGVIEVPNDITHSQVSATVRTDSFTGPLHGGGARTTLLDVAAHPRLTFSASGLRPITEPLVTADGERPLWWLPGEVTAMGHTRPLRLALGAVRPSDDGATLEFSATATVRRSDFGVGRFRRLIGDLIDVSIRGMAHRQSSDG